MVGLFDRQGRFYYRRRVPADLVTALGRREIWRSLDTDSRKLAVRRLHGAAAIVEAEFERARSRRGQSIDPMLITTLVAPSLDGHPIVAPPVEVSAPSQTLKAAPLR